MSVRGFIFLSFGSFTVLFPSRFLVLFIFWFRVFSLPVPVLTSFLSSLVPSGSVSSPGFGFSLSMRSFPFFGFSLLLRFSALTLCCVACSRFGPRKTWVYWPYLSSPCAPLLLQLAFRVRLPHAHEARCPRDSVGVRCGLLPLDGAACANARVVFRYGRLFAEGLAMAHFLVAIGDEGGKGKSMRVSIMVALSYRAV